MTPEFYIKEVTWSTHEAELRHIREQVFIKEQHVPIPLEWDQKDEAAIHLLALDRQHNSVGCTRVLNNGSIGRMAVLQKNRGVGIGLSLLRQAIVICRQRGFEPISLSAQMHATGFYEQLGFVVTSQPYLDANISHVDMVLNV